MIRGNLREHQRCIKSRALGLKTELNEIKYDFDEYSAEKGEWRNQNPIESNKIESKEKDETITDEVWNHSSGEQRSKKKRKVS